MQDIMKLCDVLRQTGFELHRYLGGGMLEKIYENGLVHRLRKMGLKVEQQSIADLRRRRHAPGRVCG
jgi:GxxExxY protein